MRVDSNAATAAHWSELSPGQQAPRNRRQKARATQIQLGSGQLQFMFCWTKTRLVLVGLVSIRFGLKAVTVLHLSRFPSSHYSFDIICSIVKWLPTAVSVQLSPPVAPPI